MIKRLEAKYISDIANVHRLAWQKAFKGILSDTLLSSLTDQEFAEHWSNTITQVDRTNLIKVMGDDKAIGFVSFGPSRAVQETVRSEIYGLYLHPAYWNQMIGYELISQAIEYLTKENDYNGIILWTMTENLRSRAFYEKVGFQPTDRIRRAQRNHEFFDEIHYQYVAP